MSLCFLVFIIRVLFVQSYLIFIRYLLDIIFIGVEEIIYIATNAVKRDR